MMLYIDSLGLHFANGTLMNSDYSVPINLTHTDVEIFLALWCDFTGIIRVSVSTEQGVNQDIGADLTMQIDWRIPK